MRRWTTLGLLAVAAFAFVASPAPAQKLLCDSQAGYFMYAHNNMTLNDGMDVNGGGAYVYFFSNAGLAGGPPTLGDNIRKCWSSYMLRGGQESVLGGPTISSWAFVLCGTVAIVTGPQTFFSISEVGSGSDFCIAPFTVNPYFLLGGFQVGTINYGLSGGCWIVAFLTGQPGAGAPIPVPAFATLNNGLCLPGSGMIFELQHGYNATALNQVYLGLVSIDEIQYPNGGGISEGSLTYGSNEWGGIVNNGTVVSYTRYLSFGTGAAILFPGQSAEGNQDGLEAYNTCAASQATAHAGRDNGTLDGAGANLTQYGSGGKDWVGCVTTTGNGFTTNKINLRTHDYAYTQLESPASACYDGGAARYDVEWFWFCTAPLQCNTFTAGNGAPSPADGNVRPLDFSSP